MTKLLLVEDDPGLGYILKEYLELNDYAVSLAKDGEIGLEIFQREDFDLCILDVMLPRKDGFSLGKEIRKLDRFVPLIFLTAKALKVGTANSGVPKKITFTRSSLSAFDRPFVAVDLFKEISWNQHIPRLGALCRSKNTVRLEHVDQSSRTGEAHAHASLQEARGALTLPNHQFGGFLK